jgi:hypothetical protein
MPPALAGQLRYLRNDGAAAAQIFGQGADTINGVATGTGISIAPGMGAVFACTTAGAWTTTPVSTIAVTANGTAGAPSISLGGMGFYIFGGGHLGLSVVNGLQVVASNGLGLANITAGLFQVRAAAPFAWSSTADALGTADAAISRSGPNGVLSNGGTTSTVTSRTQVNKTVTAIADATPTATFTVTIPNAAHSATLEYELTGILGAGGAVGVNEAVATISGKVVITRTPGANAVAVASATFGGAAANVAGAATCTVAAAVSAIAGAAGASNTFTLNITITKSGGASANHVALCYGKLMNANATGITIA